MGWKQKPKTLGASISGLGPSQSACGSVRLHIGNICDFSSKNRIENGSFIQRILYFRVWRMDGFTDPWVASYVLSEGKYIHAGSIL